MKINLLLTGSNGFIGSYLLQRILDDDRYNIIILLRKDSNLFRIEKFLTKCKVYYLNDITLETIFAENSVDCVVHLATFYKKVHTQDDIDNMMYSNITFPTKLVELASKYNIRCFINTGTFFEYSMMSNPIKETCIIHPYNLYAASKVAYEAILKFYALNSSINVISLKLAAPFGYNDNPKLIPFLINSLLDNKEVILEKGEQEWDFVYVKDVVSAYIKAIEYGLISPRHICEEILIGTNIKTSVRDIARILNEIHGQELIRCEKEYPCNQIFEAYVDNSKAKNLLQWIPIYDMKAALIETYNLYKENR